MNHLRRNPTEVRLILASYDKHGPCETFRRFDVTSRSLYRWLRAREESGDPNWPPLTEDQHWLSTAPARERRSQWMREYRKRQHFGLPGLRSSSLGTTRRIQALMRLGWTSQDIADRLGWKHNRAVTNIFDRAEITNAHRDAIAAVYDELSMRVGPSSRTRAYAERQGWPPPLAYDDIDDPNDNPKGIPSALTTANVDEVAIERVLSGDKPKRPLNPREREIVVTRLYELGLSDAQIADRAGTSDRTVLRIRQRLNLPANHAQTNAAYFASRRDGAA